MPHFFLRLIPIRPTFAHDMSEAERATMSRHADYVHGLVKAGVGFAFGPVFDPSGVWGMGIVEAADESEARSIVGKDPAVIGGVGHYEVMPMRLSFTRGGAEPAEKRA